MSYCDVVILGQVWCLIVSIPDLCPFSYFNNVNAHAKLANYNTNTIHLFILFKMPFILRIQIMCE